MPRFINRLDLDSPSFDLIFRAKMEINPAIDIGMVAEGEMKAFAIKSGMFEGKKLKGTIVPTVSVNWETNYPTGKTKGDAKITFKTKDFAFINADIYGINETESKNNYYHVLFETGHPKYSWINYILAVIRFDSRTDNEICFSCYQIN